MWRVYSLGRPWGWEGLRAGGEVDNRGWDGWMASRTQWTWVWVNSESWWCTGRPGVLRFMRSQRVGHDWVTELNWMPGLWNISCTSHIFLFHWCSLEWSWKQRRPQTPRVENGSWTTTWIRDNPNNLFIHTIMIQNSIAFEPLCILRSIIAVDNLLKQIQCSSGKAV